MRKMIFRTGLALLVAVVLALGLIAAASPAEPSVLNLAVTTSISSLNPLLVDGTEVNKYATGLAFLPLVELNSDLEFEGVLAESVETKDNKTFTVTLRDEATWSDGEPVTSDDVIFTILRLTSQTNANPNFSGFAALKGFDEAGLIPDDSAEVEGLTRVDDKTVAFNFKGETSLASFQNSFLRYLLILPEHSLKDIPIQELKASSWFAKPDVVSGPYIPQEVDYANYVAYIANTEYWKGAPKISHLNIKVVDGPQLYAGLMSGEIDLIHPTMGVIPQADIESIEALENITLEMFSSSTVQLMFLNTKTIEDVRVRQALVHAMNRERLVEGFLNGAGELTGSIFSSLSPYYADIKPLPHDPEKAVSLLEEAGWDSNKELTFNVWNGDETFVQASNVVVADLAEVGIKAKVQVQDLGTLLDNAAKHNFDLMAVQYSFAPVDPYTDLNFLFASEGNWSDYTSEAAQAVIAKAVAEEDAEKLKEFSAELGEILLEDVPAVNVYVLSTYGATANRLKNVKNGVYGTFLNVEAWEIEP